MDSLSFGAKVIGPDTGSFRDYAMNKDLNVYVFNEYKDIGNIIENYRGINISAEKYSEFLEKNNWKNFIGKALNLINTSVTSCR